MQYEIFYLVGVSLESELAKIKEEVKEIVTSFGGEFLEKETEEKRRLSYQVNHETHGIYIARRFELANKESIKEITNKLNLNNNILRFVLSKADELPSLKSKEERIAEDKQKEAKRQQKRAEQEKREEVKKTTTVKTNPSKEEKKVDQKDSKSSAKATNESIDKKLEEILNI